MKIMIQNKIQKQISIFLLIKMTVKKKQKKKQLKLKNKKKIIKIKNLLVLVYIQKYLVIIMIQMNGELIIMIDIQCFHMVKRLKNKLLYSIEIKMVKIIILIPSLINIKVH